MLIVVPQILNGRKFSTLTLLFVNYTCHVCIVTTDISCLRISIKRWGFCVWSFNRHRVHELCKSKNDSKSWNTFFCFIIFFCWGIGYKFIFRSANIGVFICLKCCGVHRSLGTHISKVIAPKSPFTILFSQ